MCCAFAVAFFYLVKNVILNNIYDDNINNNKEKCMEFEFFVFAGNFKDQSRRCEQIKSSDIYWNEKMSQ